MIGTVFFQKPGNQIVQRAILSDDGTWSSSNARVEQFLNRFHRIEDESPANGERGHWTGMQAALVCQPHSR